MRKISNDVRGYSLLELLAVIAIIAILVGISVPVISKQTEKAKETADIANLRNAYSVAVSDANTENYTDSSKYTKGTDGSYTGWFNVSTGTVQAEKPTTTGGQGKGTTKKGSENTVEIAGGITYDPSKSVVGQCIKVTITPDAESGSGVTVGFAAN